MTKEESIKRLESIKETYETFTHGLDDIHLDIEALEYAIGYLRFPIENFRLEVNDSIEYVAVSPVVKTISKDGEVVISGFREVKK